MQASKQARKAKRERVTGPQAPSRRRSRREGRRAPSLRSSDKTQHDRAGHARHEGPVLLSWERELNPTARGHLNTSTSAEAQPGTRLNPLPSLPLPVCSWQEAARLQRGGAPRRFPATASPDLRVVRRGHSSFPPARGQQYCIRGRHRPRARSLCARSACGPENRGRLGRGAERGLA